jgi:hypothetical protein
MLGVAATILLHALLFTAAIWGGDAARAVARLPDAVGAGANSGNPDGSSTERMIVIQLSPEMMNPDAEQSLAPKLDAPPTPSMLQVTGPDAIPLPPLVFADGGEAAGSTDADLIARTKLAGMYESQIRARIERAWDQPKAGASPAYFCRVKIRQKQDGQVEDVILDNCEGSLEWLDSLTKAIYSASPLPAPPDPSVFVDSFSMQFR